MGTVIVGSEESFASFSLIGPSTFHGSSIAKSHSCSRGRWLRGVRGVRGKVTNTERGRFPKRRSLIYEGPQGPAKVKRLSYPLGSRSSVPQLSSSTPRQKGVRQHV